MDQEPIEASSPRDDRNVLLVLYNSIIEMFSDLGPIWRGRITALVILAPILLLYEIFSLGIVGGSIVAAILVGVFLLARRSIRNSTPESLHLTDDATRDGNNGQRR